MAHQTGENDQALRKIVDFTRMGSLVLLVIHCYYFCYEAFKAWGYSSEFSDKVLIKLGATGLFNSIYYSKIGVILLLVISLVGVKGKKEEKTSATAAVSFVLFGSSIFFVSHYVFEIGIEFEWQVYIYFALIALGYILILTGGARLTRLLKLKLTSDIFNSRNESFPQEERLLDNQYSINLPAKYVIKGKERSSWINFINPFRSLLVIGTPGAGKSYFVIRHVITQHIRKGFSMFVYDFKFDDLSIIAYNALIQNRNAYQIQPEFYVINFDHIYHRCNPLDPSTMFDITDATESSRTIMLGLNRDWIKKQGDFFVESPINFVTAIIWFLKKFEGGCFCTLPHVIELMQLDYPTLFKILGSEREVEVLINPFRSAFRNSAMEQLEGQVASAKIGLARLSSPQLYYVLSGNDFTLDINNPDRPKIVCMGNNPQKQQIYGAVLSLYITRVIKLVNKKHQMKSSLIFDEFPTIYFNGIDTLMATARANKVATTLAVQDYSQLKKDYGKEQAEVIMNIVGNVISGQVVGETAKLLSERFGKIVQERESVSINSSDTSVSKSTQLDSAIPPSKIASLSSGEFVGMVADDPDQKISLKIFHNEIINDHEAIKREEDGYAPIPKVRDVTQEEIMENYLLIKREIEYIVDQVTKKAA
ncbi:conjugal transfer protein MobC [Pseudochryseolinea flava]|uniref:Conjugal transfer protein TraG n=1 Tax=Pseudochryseolinea flava TaxID=2059302 RepID=A0A364Y4V2_9BACT|nr:conjugal transfer protein MobC [Pseudochryseolinea flava]RAW01963.1 conjugal transfer protein TraG [Pseudochryseolinea flava]